MISATYTWGISGPDFLWFYGGLIAVVAAAIGYAWRQARGTPGNGTDKSRDLDMFELAVLNGGPELAVTTAATRLLRDGALRHDFETLVASREPDIHAHRIEREVFDTIERAHGLDMDGLHEEMAASAAIRSLRDQLVDEGLLLEQSQAARLRWTWLLGAALAVLGIARLAIAGSPAGLLFGAVGAFVVGTVWLARRCPNATVRGHRILKHWRREREDLKRLPQAESSALTVALFGAGALWLADPATAAVLGIPREIVSGSGGGAVAGCGGGGCGGG